MVDKNLKDFNKDFFKKYEENTDDHHVYLKMICDRHNIDNNQEIRALIIFFYWNYYYDKLFPNLITKKSKKEKDPRTCSIFKYCYKLQRETNGTLDEQDYKDYVFCQLKFLKSYVEKTNNPVQVTPNILNIDKGWKKWKYFKYILSKKKYSDKAKPFVNNEILKNFLKKDRAFLENKINIKNIKDHIQDIILWNRLGNISVYFMAFNSKLLKNTNKDYSVYNFDQEGKKLFTFFFPELV